MKFSRYVLCLVTILTMLSFVFSAQAGSIKIHKVLPHYLDKQGRHALNPSLFERDRYQSLLQSKKELCSTIRFDVQWRNTLTDTADLSVTVDIRGSKPGSEVISFTEKIPAKKSVWSHWTKVKIPEETFQQIEDIGAWRVVIRDEMDILEEYRSFLWDTNPDVKLIAPKQRQSGPDTPTAEE